MSLLHSKWYIQKTLSTFYQSAVIISMCCMLIFTFSEINPAQISKHLAQCNFPPRFSWPMSCTAICTYWHNGDAGSFITQCCAKAHVGFNCKLQVWLFCLTVHLLHCFVTTCRPRGLHPWNLACQYCVPVISIIHGLRNKIHVTLHIHHTRLEGEVLALNWLSLHPKRFLVGTCEAVGFLGRSSLEMMCVKDDYR